MKYKIFIKYKIDLKFDAKFENYAGKILLLIQNVENQFHVMLMPP